MSRPKSQWNKDSVKELLSSNTPRGNSAVERAIIVVFNNQTADEQRTEDVRYHNGKGFLPMHARRGTYYANWILSGRHLNAKHLEIARKMALKYSRQLLLAIKEKNND